MKIGILGGGQLARMMILDGKRLGFSFRVFDEKLHSSTKELAPCHTGSFLDREALKNFAEGLDVITCEFENIPADTIDILSEYVPCFPSSVAFSVAQDRLSEKDMMASLEIGTTKYQSISSLDDLEIVKKDFSFPLLIKSRRLGYDGKGQKKVTDPSEIADAWSEIGSCDAIAEAFVNFERELSIVGVYGRNGKKKHYPLIENVHENGILVSSFAPADASDDLNKLAQEMIDKIAEKCGYIGVLVVEFFQVGNTLLVNEIAPRVHNSGHCTIEGAVCSQFENQIRAVSGMPLGCTEMRFSTISYNILSKLPDTASVLGQTGAHLHLYDKEESDLRKLGHITFCNYKQLPIEEFLKEAVV